jgi:hypothetical protein
VGGVPPAILMEWIHLGCIDTRQQKDVNNGLSLRLRMQNFADMCLQAAPRWELCSRTVGGHSWRRRTSTMWNQALDSRSKHVRRRLFRMGGFRRHDSNTYVRRFLDVRGLVRGPGKKMEFDWRRDPSRTRALDWMHAEGRKKTGCRQLRRCMRAREIWSFFLPGHLIVETWFDQRGDQRN